MEDRFFHKDPGQRNPGMPCAKRFTNMSHLHYLHLLNLLRSCNSAFKIRHMKLINSHNSATIH
jgi:hypothetical protein